jgi:isoquinoline 1-oxidoreductase
MVMGDTDVCPWDAGTFGSRTTPTMGPQLRLVAATAREALVDLAAERWKMPREQLTADNGRVRAAGRTPLLYGELTRGEKLVKTLPAEGGGAAGTAAASALTPPAQWKVAGLRTPKVDGRAFVTGAHQYTSDLKRPGMLFGRTLRAPSFEATLVSLDAAKAEAMPGVKVVRDGDYAGLVAPDAFTAERAIAALGAGSGRRRTASRRTRRSSTSSARTPRRPRRAAEDRRRAPAP